MSIKANDPMDNSPQHRYAILRKTLRRTVLIAFLSAADAIAQVRLPTIPNTQLPPIQIPDASGALNSVTGALDPNRLRDLRELRIRALLRTYRRELEADPNGDPIVRGEIVAYSPSASSLAIFERLGLTIARETTLSNLDVRVVYLKPRSGSTRAALRRLRRADPSGNYDFNHVYVESGALVASSSRVESEDVVERPVRSATDVKVGLIDTGVDRSHPDFAGARIEQFGCDGAQIPAAHGTAVASLLIGHAAQFKGAAPGATLYAADVYCAKPTGGSIENIAAAFDWLLSQGVPVINVSLVGPRNQLLEKLVSIALAHGHTIVAAVGNDGPSAPPLFPAAYAGVIGVTGVDSKRRVLLEAGRGPHVYFAAPGANMGAAGLDRSYVEVRGTSFAAPIVAGLLATHIVHADQNAMRRALEALDAEAVDLGARGFDKTYGHGLVGESIRTDPKGLLIKK